MEKEHSTKREKALNPNTRVNYEKLSDDMIRERMRDIEKDASVAREISVVATRILKHRDGTLFEDLAFVDSVAHRTKVNMDYDYYNEEAAESRCSPNKPMWNILHQCENHTIISIHNHPNSGMVSFEDVARCYEREYKYGLVFCHSGTIFKYFVDDKYNPDYFYAVQTQLEKLQKSLYNNGGNADEERANSAVHNLKEKGVILEVYL